MAGEASGWNNLRPTAATGATAERGTKLIDFDSTACKVLSLYGRAAFTKEPSSNVWAMVSKGSKKIGLQSKLASNEDWKAGVGTSCVAETLPEIFAALPVEGFERSCGGARPAGRLWEETADVEPCLTIVSFGKGRAKDTGAGQLSEMFSAHVAGARARMYSHQKMSSVKPFWQYEFWLAFCCWLIVGAFLCHFVVL